MSKTDVLDIVGLGLLSGFAFIVWAPLPLLVVGLAALFASWRSTR